MKFSKKILLSVLMVVLAATSFAKTKLNLFMYKQEIVSQFKEIIDEFEKDYPDIEIDVEIAPNDSMTVLKTKLVGGQAPDIIQLAAYANVFEFAKAGWLEDISREAVIKKVNDGTLNSVTYNNRVYALPMDVAGIGIIYNKRIFKKYGLTPPKTYKELRQVAKILKRNGVTPFAGLFKANWSLGHFLSMTHSTLAGEDLLEWIEAMNEGEASFGDPVDPEELFALLDFYRDNVDQKAAEMDWNEQQASFAGEEAAMMVQGLWSYGAAIGTNPNLDCGFIPFPVNNNEEDTKMFADVDSTFAIAKNIPRKNKTAAKTFLNWLSTDKAVKLWVEKAKLVPTFKGADVSSMKQPFQDLMSYVQAGKTNPWAFQMYPVAAWEDATKNGAQEYMFGSKNEEQVIDYIDSVWMDNIK
jgi:raffinose/stachyose/melibiose transport system substrate-binding protein